MISLKLVLTVLVVVPALLVALVPYIFPAMFGRSPHLLKFREQNSKVFLGGKKVLVVGGTAGIGTVKSCTHFSNSVHQELLLLYALLSWELM